MLMAFTSLNSIIRLKLPSNSGLIPKNDILIFSSKILEILELKIFATIEAVLYIFPLTIYEKSFFKFIKLKSLNIINPGCFIITQDYSIFSFVKYVISIKKLM